MADCHVVSAVTLV